MIKFVIFDMDGLLVDSERAMWIPNESASLKEMGYEQDLNFLMSLMGGARVTNVAKYKERFGEDFDVDRFYDILISLNDISVANNEVPLKEGARELIKYLKENNIGCCVGTSSPKEYATNVLNNNKVLNEFKFIITGDDVKLPKPSPEIYQKCLALSGCNADEVIIFEDAHNGALAARDAGIRCVLVPDLGILFDWDFENHTVIKNLYEAIDIIKLENERTSSI